VALLAPTYHQPAAVSNRDEHLLSYKQELYVRSQRALVEQTLRS
jgi:hypothetical protein